MKSIPSDNFAMLLIVLAATIAGCTPQKTTGDDFDPPPLTEKVKLSDLADKPAGTPEVPDITQPANTPGTPGIPTAPGSTNAAAAPAGGAAAPAPIRPAVPAVPQPPVYRITAQTLIYPRNLPELKLATRMIQTAQINPRTLETWQANGFGVGRLPRTHLPMLVANMPRPMALEVTNIQSEEKYVPLTLVDRIQGAQPIRITGADGEPTHLKFTSGKCNLLLRIVNPIDNPFGQPRLDMIPQHYTPLPMVLPRQVDKKILDGTIFSDLRLEEAADPKTAWVVWLTVPPSPEEIAVTQSAGKPTNRPPTPGTTDILQPVGKTELTLAESMLTGRRGTTPIQMMVILVTDELPRQ